MTRITYRAALVTTLCALLGSSLARGEDPLRLFPTSSTSQPPAPAVVDEEDSPLTPSQSIPIEFEVDGTPVEAGQGTSPPADNTATTASPPEGSDASPAEKKPAAKPPKKPPAPYKGVFYDNDFSYLEKPDNEDCYLGDNLKRLRPTCSTRLDIGGEYRFRWHNERFLRGSNLSGRSDDFLLHRTRLYGDGWYDDVLRGYVEAIDATSNYEDFPPRVIEENRWDFLNLFGEAMLLDGCYGRLNARVGRQELLYGDQRLISPLDWGNTRRTFDGAKLLWVGEDWNADAFWSRPVGLDQHVNNDHNLDRWDSSQEFMGLYATYKAIQDQAFDLYYLRYAEENAPGTAVFPTDFDYNTFGARWRGKHCDWLWDFEGGFQFGQYGGNRNVPNELPHFAGYFTCGLGRELTSLPSSQSIWLYYDWASGDGNPNDGSHGTFNQMFPLAHKYLGFMDLIARQNIQDINILYTMKPASQFTLLCWWHCFFLQSSRDALYNALGAPIRFDPTGASGPYVGQEIDLLGTLALSPRAELGLGFSYFWGGTFVDRTNPPNLPGGGDASFVYTQYQLRF